MIQLNGWLDNIERVCNDTKYDVEKFTYITETAVHEILYKQEHFTKELNCEITKLGNDLSDQLKQSVDELNTKFNEKQNVIQN